MTRSVTDRLSARLEGLAGRAQRAFSTPGRSTRTTVVLGRVLGILMVVCFATGLYSHVLQSPPAWVTLSPQPAQLYRFTQGVHVLAGLAMVPVLLGKLWSVFPRLFHWPPVTGVLSVLERLSIAVLVASALVEVAIGVMNIAQWYPFPFSFRRVHFALAWVLMGSIMLHIAVKLPSIREHWHRSRTALPDVMPRHPVVENRSAHSSVISSAESEVSVTESSESETQENEAVSRRGAIAAVGAAAGFILATTAGQTFAPLSGIAFLAPRRPFVGPQGLPVNRTAVQAGAAETAVDPAWTLTIIGRRSSQVLTLAQLNNLPQTEADLPIACVEGWSQQARWGGVAMRDLLAILGEDEGELRLTSLQTRGAFAATTMPVEYVRDPTTLAALRLGDEPLDIDHGYPARAIAPGRPGVVQTKWLSRIEVIS